MTTISVRARALLRRAVHIRVGVCPRCCCFTCWAGHGHCDWRRG